MAANGSVLGGDRALTLTVEIRPVYERTDDPARVRGFYSAIRQWIQLAYQYSLEHAETNPDLTPSPFLHPLQGAEAAREGDMMSYEAQNG